MQRENEALTKFKTRKYVQKQKDMFKKKLCPGKLGG